MKRTFQILAVVLALFTGLLFAKFYQTRINENVLKWDFADILQEIKTSTALTTRDAELAKTMVETTTRSTRQDTSQRVTTRITDSSSPDPRSASTESPSYDFNTCTVDLRENSTAEYTNPFLDRSRSRLRDVESNCDARSLGLKSWNIVHRLMDKHVFVDERNKVLYFPVFKAGSTSWGIIFAHILLPRLRNMSNADVFDNIKWDDVETLPHLNKYPTNIQAQMWENYFKFTFVREPFERLLSAFRNKFMIVGGNFYRDLFGPRISIHEKSFSTPVDNSTIRVHNGKIISFRSFFRYLGKTSPTQYDEHWRLFSKLVFPCAVKFDFIGKLETMESDFNYLSNCRLHEGSYASLFQSKKPETDALYKQFYDTVDRNDIIKVFEIWKNEYKIYGYETPAIVKEAYKNRH